MFVLISYDVPDDKRRSRIAKTLQNAGRRVQYSVFECRLTARQLQNVRQQLTDLVRPTEDSVRFYFLPQDAVATIEILGRGTVTDDPIYYAPRSAEASP